MKIAVLGGSFNPIHNAHIKIARIVYNKLKPSKFLFVPTYRHPLKTNTVFLPYEKRLYLVKKAIAHYPEFEVSNLDKTEKNFSYTSDLIRKLKNNYPQGDFYFIIGKDNVAELKLWHNYRWLLKNLNFIVLTREIESNENPPDYAKDFIYYKIEPIDISSTMIREKIKKGEPISGLVPQNIETDIITLYKPIL